MEIQKDSAGFLRAVGAYFHKDTSQYRSVCSCDQSGTPLGGCAFTPLDDGVTYAYILALSPKWASDELYREIMRFPFLTMGAKQVLAVVKSDDSRNIGLRMGGVLSSDRSLMTFDRATVLTKAKDISL